MAKKPRLTLPSPKESAPRSAKVLVSLTPEQRSLLEKLAELRGEPASTTAWVIIATVLDEMLDFARDKK